MSIILQTYHHPTNVEKPYPGANWLHWLADWLHWHADLLQQCVWCPLLQPPHTWMQTVRMLGSWDQGSFFFTQTYKRTWRPSGANLVKKKVGCNYSITE